MIEVRFHGRGGQGAVTSAEMLALASIEEGRYAQAMPSFGPERRGAPVAAFARIDDHRIRLRIGITTPDIVIVLDPSLVGLAAVQQGLKPGGMVIVNSPEDEAGIRKAMNGYAGRLASVNATEIALKILRVPITNTSMLGAFAKATGDVRVESFVEPLKKRFGKIAARNIEALKAAHEETRIHEGR
ncbi:MAG: pyruvate synthase [Deltaproteobacteria bacterium]|nr:pyruvate synthase [Deltaproteobacteria bacterium]